MSVFRVTRKDAEPNADRFVVPAALEDGRVPGLPAKVSVALISLLATAAVWASISQIQEFAVGRGEIIPEGSVQIIDHLEGGEVAQVYVTDGAIVRAGAPILRLKPVAATSDLEQLRVQQADLQLRRISISALIDGAVPDFTPFNHKYPDLVAEQQNLFHFRREHHDQERLASLARVGRQEADLKMLQLQAASLKRQREIKEEGLSILRPLAEAGYSSRQTLLAAEFEYEQVHESEGAASEKIASANEALTEARSNLQSEDADFMRTLSEERAKVVADLSEVEQQLRKFEDRVENLIVRSPADGIIHELTFQSPGGVLKQGDPVAKLVPMNREIVAEVALDPKDVGHVTIGSEADVTLTSFDSGVYGTIGASVISLSPFTFQTADQQPYFRAVLRLEASEIGTGEKRRPILPGMIVEAHMITGSKSLAKYFLRPLLRPFDVAFSER